MTKQPANDNDSCPSCGSGRLEWQPDNGWITRPIRYLRCTDCGDCARSELPMWGWAMYGIALAAGVWGWILVVR